MMDEGKERMKDDTNPNRGITANGGNHREVDLFSTNEAFESEFWHLGTGSPMSTRQLL